MLSLLVPAFLAGLVALAIPVWVHLRNRQRTDTVDFPSVMFLEQIPFKTVQRQQLRHRALFALRCVAIALLVFAFARPFVPALGVAAGDAAGAREVVVLVDRSWSMQYSGHWAAAQQAVREEAAATGLSQVEVVEGAIELLDR